MIENIAGVILRETPIGEADKMMTVLTAKYGRISVFARGAKRLKSPLFTASQLFSYSDLTVSKSTNGTYQLRSADLIESFYHIRDTLEGAALASYMADVAADIAVEDEDETSLFRLVLNCFHAISVKKKPLLQIKAVLRSARRQKQASYPTLSVARNVEKAKWKHIILILQAAFSVVSVVSVPLPHAWQVLLTNKARRTAFITQGNTLLCFPHQSLLHYDMQSMRKWSAFLPLS